MRHFLTLADYTKEEILDILELAKTIKIQTKNKIFKNYLEKQTLAMIFEKSSTRTRVSFETGIYQLGGVGLFLSSNDIQLGRGEPISDTSKVVSSMCDMLMIRTFEHDKIEEFAKHSSVPVINGLTDDYHPVQLMADYMTIQEEGLDKDLIVTYIGDGNNLAHSWLNLASKLGFELRLAMPKGYQVDKKILEKALEAAKKSGAKIITTTDKVEASRGASVITTDTWVSMGNEVEKLKRIIDFEPYNVDDALMSVAKDNAIFLHCLPAYRGSEVSTSVIDGKASRVFQEAENRLHAQKGIMVWLDQQLNK